ncbi:hypothetical protein ACFZB2_38100 [Streptomyces bobili]|uniref:hypothetical protein n=1 Tax=Streptomyces bobili TaxID=67280 RepID=UPI0036E73FA1
MKDSTQAAPMSYGWCSWHQAAAAGVRLINFQEQGSGPGGGTFACGTCIETHGLIPFEDQPCTPVL